MKAKSLSVNALLNSLQTILNLIFPLITFPYVSRVLSVDSIGKYNFSNSIVSYFILIAGLGISRFAVREGAKLRDDRKLFSVFASEIFTINLCSTAFSYLLLFITLLLVSSLQSYKEAILIFSIQIFFTTVGMDWLYTIYEEYGYITIRNIIFKIISIILLFTLVKHSDDYLKYVSITVFASTGSYLLNFFHAKRFFDLTLRWNFNWREYLIPIFSIFGTMVAVTIYVSSDTTILGFLKGDYAVGIYSIATKIYGMIGPVVSSTMAVAIPRLAMLIGRKRYLEYRSLLTELINTTIVVIFPVMTGLVLVSKDVVLLIAGSNFLRSAVSLKILSIALLFGTINTIFVECVLIPAKRENKTLVSSIVAAIVNILLNFAMIPIFIEKGSAVTTVIAEFTSMLLNYYFGKDIIGNIYDKRFFSNLLTVIIGCSTIIIVCGLVNNIITNVILRLVSSVVLSSIIYIFVLYLLNNTIAKNIIARVRIRIG
ncbi:flippase [Limosilactobacillus mucosae]|uniref:flippase n=1 Tax=Limosilactobacillus mucosae TaxID=97478 RepID=UPI0025A452C6|nr:flippase [Limosilactobacillus mucosae]MDM8219008.1 flippase [Limosilactobacillus mucosae]MDM8313664.1 flippase [Limosilactobacillus mucosae]